MLSESDLLEITSFFFYFKPLHSLSVDPTVYIHICLLDPIVFLFPLCLVKLVCSWILMKMN